MKGNSYFFSALLTATLLLSGSISFSQSSFFSDSLSYAYQAHNTIPPVEFIEPEKEREEIIDKTPNNKLNTPDWLKPLVFNIGRTSYSFDYSGRLQPQFDYHLPTESLAASHKLYFRRIRFKSKGHLFTPELGYKFEMDLLDMKILDLILKWKAGNYFSIWAGQTKLRGNRERVISSQNLQFVDRSLLNSKFTLDRDIGIWIMYDRMYGNVAIRKILSVSKGEGKDYSIRDVENNYPGFDYTGRIEILPFGYFTGGGDYSASDLAREKSPKLAIGFTYDFNNNAVRSNGQKGKVLDTHGNLSSYVVDAMFKYNGMSWMSEYTNRKVFMGSTQSPDHFTPERFYTGNAVNTQMGYLFRSNFEIATRYTHVMPEKITGNHEMTEYTIGLSKYLNGHKLKIQSDFSLLHEETKDHAYRFRLQMELSI